jgi:predicted amidohydrolase YtcJ
MMRNIFLLLTLFINVIVVKAQKPDMILYNGKIFTSDEKQLFVQALAIKGNKIFATGGNSAITKLAGKNTQKIDLHGKTVIPGINDAHFHLGGGFKATTIQFKTMDPGWSELKDSLQKISARLKKGEWIDATIGPSVANSKVVNRFALDSITAIIPVRLISWWGHVGIYNTIGLTSVGISTTQANPPGGRYERTADGVTLTGKCFEENAYNPQSSYQIFSSLRDSVAFVAYLKGISQAFLRLGITSVQNMCTGANPSDYVSFWKKAGLPFRLRLIRWADMSEGGGLLVPDTQLPVHIKELPLVTVSGTKWLLDGTPIEGGAAVTEGYSYDAAHFGYLNYSARNIERFLQEAISRNDQICFHAAGDSTANTILDAMEKINIDWKPRRVRIEHGDGLLPGQLARAKKLGIIVVANPLHFEKATAGVYRGKIAREGFRFRSLLNASIPVAIGSDGPFNPYLNLMFAVTDPLHPDEAISIEQAVIAYTKTSAYAQFEEKQKGTLVSGKLADLTVLSQDIFSIIPQQLPKTYSLMTLVDGKIVYKK